MRGHDQRLPAKHYGWTIAMCWAVLSTKVCMRFRGCSDTAGNQKRLKRKYGH